VRLTELLASRVVDAAGTSLGPVRDVRVVERQPGGAGARFRVSGLVIGGGFLARPAHAWGFAEGRASGPWLLRALTSRAVRRARFIPADRVADWGPGVVAVTGALADFPPLTELAGP
jgi:hypothetical protein